MNWPCFLVGIVLDKHSDYGTDGSSHVANADILQEGHPGIGDHPVEYGYGVVEMTGTEKYPQQGYDCKCA